MPSAPLPPDPPVRSFAPISRVSSARDSTSDPNNILNGQILNHNNLHSSNRELNINDIVGNGISGIVYKWVNYEKGWRLRWFLLPDGVLSYYKINEPDKIEVNQETKKGLRVIGEESSDYETTIT